MTQPKLPGVQVPANQTGNYWTPNLEALDAEKKKYAKIAYKLQDKKKRLAKDLNDVIIGIHADAELQIDEVRKLIRKMIIKEAGVFDTPDAEPSGEDQSRVMAKLQTKFEGPVKNIINLIKTKDDLNAAVSMLISKAEETTTGLGRRAKVLLLKTVKDL